MPPVHTLESVAGLATIEWIAEDRHLAHDCHQNATPDRNQHHAPTLEAGERTARTSIEVAMTQSTTIKFDDETYTLPPGSDLANLMERIEGATHSEAAFVTFATAGNLVSVLVGSHTRVTVCVDPTVETGAMGILPDDWADWNL